MSSRRPLTLRRAILSGGTVFLLLSGCFTPSGHLANTTPRERIAPTEDEIQTAVHGQVDLTGEHNVSVYAHGVPDDIAVHESFQQLPDTVSVQRISTRFMAAGEPVGQLMRDLRMHSAQAGADRLIVLDFNIQHATDLNGWYALSPLLLPILFTPWLDVEVESSLEWYVVDVATGSYVARGRSTVDKVELRSNIYRVQQRGDALVESQRTELLERAAHDIQLILAGASAG